MSEDRRVSLSAPVEPPVDPAVQPPADVVPLPSKGVCYPPGHPFHGAEYVEILPMTARQEDILTSRALIKSGRVISTLIRSCLVQRGVDVDELLTGDRNALLIAIRVTGYGSVYPVEVTCPACDAKTKTEFDLSKLPIRPMAATPLQLGVNSFEFTLPVTKRRVVFKIETGASDREVSQEIEGQKKKLGPAAEANVTTTLFHHIVDIAGETEPAKLRRLIESMPAGDSKALRRHIAKISPGVDMTQEFECLACGAKSEVDVPIGTDFFWPGD